MVPFGKIFITRLVDDAYVPVLLAVDQFLEKMVFLVNRGRLVEKDQVLEIFRFPVVEFQGDARFKNGTFCEVPFSFNDEFEKRR
jgi:hypothetical protein